MGVTLTQQRRVYDESVYLCKVLLTGTKRRMIYVYMTVPVEEAPANSVPAAAVIRGELALSGIIGRKGHVGGTLSQLLNRTA